MDISTIADQVYQFLKGVNSDTVNQVVSENMMIAPIVTTVIGIFLSMFGLKLIRLWSALLGLVVGAGIGFAVTELAGLEPMIVVGATIGGGIVLAFLAGFFYRFGIFLLTLLTGTYIAILFVNPQDWIFPGCMSGNWPCHRITGIEVCRTNHDCCDEYTRWSARRGCNCYIGGV